MASDSYTELKIEKINDYIRNKFWSYVQPEIFLRPSQISYFLKRKINKAHGTFEEVVLPWNYTIRIRPNEYMGKNIWRNGVYDITVCEAISGLLDPGKTAVDVGANIGQMTSVMAKSVGREGTVYSFEPHPEVYQELEYNRVHFWTDKANIHTERIAISDEIGEMYLDEGMHFGGNRGVASLSDNEFSKSNKKNQKIKVTTLDDYFSKQIYKNIELLKIDVEGFELNVLRGARNLLEKKAIRNIIYEETSKDPYTSPSCKFLKNQRYELFYLVKNMFGIEIGDLKKGEVKYKSYTYYSCLATSDAERLLFRLKNRPWTLLKSF